MIAKKGIRCNFLRAPAHELGTKTGIILQSLVRRLNRWVIKWRGWCCININVIAESANDSVVIDDVIFEYLHRNDGCRIPNNRVRCKISSGQIKDIHFRGMDMMPTGSICDHDLAEVRLVFVTGVTWAIITNYINNIIVVNVITKIVTCPFDQDLIDLVSFNTNGSNIFACGVGWVPDPTRHLVPISDSARGIVVGVDVECARKCQSIDSIEQFSSS